MTSVSSFGSSADHAAVTLDRDIDAAQQDVQSRLNAASNLLPRTLPARDLLQEQPRDPADPDPVGVVGNAAAARHTPPVSKRTDTNKRRLEMKEALRKAAGLYAATGSS